MGYVATVQASCFHSIDMEDDIAWQVVMVQTYGCSLKEVLPAVSYVFFVPLTTTDSLECAIVFLCTLLW